MSTCQHTLIASLSPGGVCILCPDPTLIVGVGSMTPDEARGLLARIRAVNARERLADFVKQAWNETDPTVPLDWSWHHDVVCDHLQRMFLEWVECTRGQRRAPTVQNLLVNIPPGTNKSRIISVFFPAWAWLHEPAWRVIALSANPQVAERDAPIARALIESDWYRKTFNIQWTLREDVNARGWYVNSCGGERRSFGIGARIVGLRGDAILCDDPNDPKEIHSEVTRENINVRAWDQAIGNRLNDLKVGLRIGIQQRLHEDDWSGHVLRQGGWEHLRLPLIAEATNDCRCETCTRGHTLYGWRDTREPGEVLHPSRFPQRVIDAEMSRLGAYGFSGQYQQRPAPESGAVFRRDWFRYYDPNILPGFDDVLISCDLANSDHASKTNSNNALIVVGRKGRSRYVLDAVIGRWSFREICERIRDLQAEWDRKSKRAVKILVERKAAGNLAISALKVDMQLQGVVEDAEAQRAHNDKTVRAMAIQPQVEGGDVLLPRGAPWVDAFLHEVCTFPSGARDDQVDALTQALNYYRGSNAAAAFMGANRKF